MYVRQWLYPVCTVLFCSLLVVVSCATPAETPPATEVPTDVPPSGPEEPVYGGEIVIGVTAWPGIFDMAYIAGTGIMLSQNVMDPLVRIGADLSAVPGLAKDWETPDGGQTWDFHLVETTWHDGEPFSSQDVKAHFDRLLDPDTGSPGASVFQIVDSIDAVEPDLVRFRLKSADMGFPLLTGEYQGPIQAAHLDPADYEAPPMIGTGPFVWESHEPGESITLVRNSDYFMEDVPYLDRIHYVVYEDAAARVSALRTGAVDVIPQLPFALAPQLDGREGFVLAQGSVGAMYTVFMRADQAPGDDPRVMQALKLALDREAYRATALGGYGVASADNPIAAVAEPYVELGVPSPDIDAARALLAQAGYADGLDIEMVVPVHYREPAIAVQSLARDAGFNIELTLLPGDIFFAEYWLKQNFSITDWNPRPNLDAQFRVAYVCGAAWNESHWCDPEFDTMLDEARAESDPERRAALQEELQRYWNENANTATPGKFGWIDAHREGVEDLVPHIRVGSTDFRRVWLSSP